MEIKVLHKANIHTSKESQSKAKERIFDMK